MGFALAAVGSFDSAVKYIKDGLDLDPQWPSHGDRLESIFGEDNRLMILLTERIAMWVREDIRDPDRLFLMGVWLHFDGDNRATPFFETAYRLAGYGDHLLAFLLPGNGAGGQPFAGPPGHTHETFPADPSRPGLFQPGPLAPNSTQPNSAQPNTPQFNLTPARRPYRSRLRRWNHKKPWVRRAWCRRTQIAREMAVPRLLPSRCVAGRSFNLGSRCISRRIGPRSPDRR